MTECDLLKCVNGFKCIIPDEPFLDNLAYMLDHKVRVFPGFNIPYEMSEVTSTPDDGGCGLYAYYYAYNYQPHTSWHLEKPNRDKHAVTIAREILDEDSPIELGRMRKPPLSKELRSKLRDIAGLYAILFFIFH